LSIRCAFTNGRGPRLHHCIRDAASDCDHRLARSDGHDRLCIERRAWPGRHSISNALFFYIRDPDGHRIEIYCWDYQTVDPDLEPIKWDLKDPQRQILWGAPAPKSRFEEGSSFTGAAVIPAKLNAQPIVAL
jgi:catechol 2,3-dioxygenase